MREVLDTMRVAARLGSGSLGAYVISMSRAASDVLAVELLQKEARLMVGGGTHLQGGEKGEGHTGTLARTATGQAAA